MGTFQQPSANRNYARGDVQIDDTGRMRMQLLITNDAGKKLDSIEIYFPISGPITDSAGNQLSASVPAAIANARNSLGTAIDNAIDSAAAAGKFVR